MELNEVVARYFWLEDLVIAEGFKRSHYPKVEIFRAVVESTPICSSGDNLLAVVTDDPVETEVPVFRFQDVGAVADLIETRFLKDRKKARIAVHVDGKKLPMNEFVRDFVISTVLGMFSSLRGWKKPKSLNISIQFGDD